MNTESGKLCAVPTLLDEVEFRRVQAAGYAGDLDPRDAVDIVVNGRSLSEALATAPFSLQELHSVDAVNAWRQHDNYAPILNCLCGDVGCGGVFAYITLSADTVGWTVLEETYVFDGEQFWSSLRAALRD